MRGRGGYIGFNRVPAASAINSAASGVWTLREAEALKRAGTWPRNRVTVLPVMTGLQLWLDADDSTTLYDATTGGSLVAADGGVARWEDKSGNARHMTQGTAGSRPTRKTAIQGGLDVLRFDGSADFMSVASSTATFNFLHDGDSTTFIVFKPDGTAASERFDFLLNNNVQGGSITGKIGFYIRWDNNRSDVASNRTVVVIANNGIPRFVGVPNTGTFAPDTAHVLSFVGDMAQSTAGNRGSLRRNGGSALSLDTSATGNSAVPTENASHNMTLGKSANSADYFYDGDMCEIICYDSALSDTNRALVEAYLLAKWGIT